MNAVTKCSKSLARLARVIFIAANFCWYIVMFY